MTCVAISMVFSVVNDTSMECVVIVSMMGSTMLMRLLQLMVESMMV